MERKLWMKFIAVVVLAIATVAHGQLTTATVTGTVTDSTGAVVANATVTATNSDTHFSRSGTSNGQGEYRIEFLPIGNYTVKAEAPSFSTQSQSNVTLTLNMEQRLDFDMKPGNTSQVVEVTAAPPMIETTVATVGRTIQNVEVDNLPLVSRNPYDLVNLAPGVQSNSLNRALGFPQQVIYINGGTDNEVGSVNYYLDGGINMTMLRNTGNILPNPDALQEMNIMTNSYSALYGRSSSGVVNVATKSGTNSIHGSIFEFIRSDKLNANPGLIVGKSRLHRNQFGATLGGPVIKDKTFFFGSYGGYHNNTSSKLTGAIVPTDAERASNFTNFSDKLPSGTITKCDQATAADTAAGKFILCTPSSANAITGANNNLAPVANNDLNNIAGAYPLDPAAANILKTYIPRANGVNTSNVPVWSGYVNTPEQQDEFLIKINHNLTKAHRLDATYYMSVGFFDNSPGGNIPWVINYYPYRQQIGNLSDTWTISDRKVNQVWLNYTRMLGGRVNTPGISLHDLGSTFAPVGTPSLPQVTVSGAFTLANAIAGPKAGTNFYSVRDVYTWNIGRHSIGLGGEMELNKDIQQTLLNNYGVFSFTGTKGLRTGQGIGDFVLGLNSAVSQDIPVTASDNSWIYGTFLQDDWKVRNNLTLNLGLRWDVQTPPTDPANQTATFVAGRQSAVSPGLPKGLLVPGDPGVTRGVVGIRWHHVSPRVGFAYVPFTSGKTAIRGAAGIFYGMVSGNLWNAPSNFQPYAARTTYSPAQLGHFSKTYENFPGGVSPFVQQAFNPAAPHLLLPNSLEGIDLNYQWPYTYQLNFSVQQQIGKDFSFTISYIGNLSHDLPMDYDANAPQYSPTQTTANKDARRPLFTSENIQQVYMIASGQSAHYHALEVDFEKRLSHSLSVKGYYTWSKTYESASIQNTTAQNNPQNFNFINEDRGPADDDARHRFNVSVVWKTNYFSHSNLLTRSLLNGWTVSAITTARSGLPYSITTGVDTNLDGNTNDRASRNPNVPITPLDSAHSFNPLAFCAAGSVPPSGGICPGIGPGNLDGNTQRDSFYGHGLVNVDGAVFRDFPIWERVKFQFRAEAINAFNIINLNNPNGSLNAGSATGTITAGSQARQLQLGGRILF